MYLLKSTNVILLIYSFTSSALARTTRALSALSSALTLASISSAVPFSNLAVASAIASANPL